MYTSAQYVCCLYVCFQGWPFRIGKLFDIFSFLRKTISPALSISLLPIVPCIDEGPVGFSCSVSHVCWCYPCSAKQSHNLHVSAYLWCDCPSYCCIQPGTIHRRETHCPARLFFVSVPALVITLMKKMMIKIIWLCLWKQWEWLKGKEINPLEQKPDINKC